MDETQAPPAEPVAEGESRASFCAGLPEWQRLLMAHRTKDEPRPRAEWERALAAALAERI